MIGRVITASSSRARTIRFSPLVQSLNDVHVDRSFTGNQGSVKTHHPALFTSEHEKYVSTQSSSLFLNQTDTTPEKGMPFKRSQKSTESNHPTFLFDTRAEAKILALNESKANLVATKAKYKTRKQNTQPGDAYLAQLHQEVIASQQQLALAYSQAIKYCSRIPNNPDATFMAENLFYEWMGRFLDELNTDEIKVAVDTNAIMKKKWMIKTIHALLPPLKSDSQNVSDAGHHLPPPTSKDYINLLRSYSISKARRKGEQAEALLVNMLMLAEASSTAEKEVRASWIKENIPNSKMFALAVKCYAGSTREYFVYDISFCLFAHSAPLLMIFIPLGEQTRIPWTKYTS